MATYTESGAASIQMPKAKIPWGTVLLVGGAVVGGGLLIRAYKQRQAALGGGPAIPTKKVPGSTPTVSLPKPKVTVTPGGAPEPVRPPGSYASATPSPFDAPSSSEDYSYGAKFGRADGIAALATLSYDPSVDQDSLMVHYDTDKSDAWKKGYKDAFKQAIG